MHFLAGFGAATMFWSVAFVLATKEEISIFIPRFILGVILVLIGVFNW